MKHKKWFIIAPIIIVVVAILSLGSAKEPVKTDWRKEYVQAMQSAKINEAYLQPGSMYDYQDARVQSVADSIKNSSTSARNAVVRAAEHVYSSVKYDADETTATCLRSTSVSVLVRGSGQCDTQSIALIGLLRGMNIAAKPVGGCIVKKGYCDVTQAMTAQRSPRFKPMISPDSLERGAEGNLHLWVQAWLPDEGWVNVESTTGKIVPVDSCYTYLVEDEISDDDRIGICSAKSYEFANFCYATINFNE